MKNNLDELNDDELYASYEAYKALIEAGLSKDQAMSRTGLTAQIVKDFESEEEELDLKSDFKEVWDEEDDTEWSKDSGFKDDDDSWENDEYSDDYSDDSGDDYGYDEEKY